MSEITAAFWYPAYRVVFVDFPILRGAFPVFFPTASGTSLECDVDLCQTWQRSTAGPVAYERLTASAAVPSWLNQSCSCGCWARGILVVVCLLSCAVIVLTRLQELSRPAILHPCMCASLSQVRGQGLPVRICAVVIDTLAAGSGPTCWPQRTSLLFWSCCAGLIPAVILIWKGCLAVLHLAQQLPDVITCDREVGPSCYLREELASGLELGPPFFVKSGHCTACHGTAYVAANVSQENVSREAGEGSDGRR